MRWIVALAIAGCGDDNAASIDARVAIDVAAIDTPPQCEVFELVSCLGSTARVSIESFDGCAAPMMREHTCTSACDLEFDRINLGKRTMFSVDPATLCAETPAAFLHSPCGVTSFCLPTRVVLANDGTVESQDYIACGEELCISRPAPVIAGYGSPCTATVYDERDPSRAACFAGASTEYCIGDWECPAQMLCDDRASTPRPVCKPGPRG